MGIKNLFDKEKNTKIVSQATQAEEAENVESVGYISARIDQKYKFEPHVDYASASSFAKFGSAKKYYTDTISNIYTYYPFDGSFKEKTQWMVSASGIQQYIFDNEYPRTNGYINFSYGGWGSIEVSYPAMASPDIQYSLPDDEEYITIYGGPNKDPDGSGKTLANIFENSSSNFYNASEDRESNLEFANPGNTIEWWMKKDEWLPPTTGWSHPDTRPEVIFDLWASGSDPLDGNYGRFAVMLNSSSLGSTTHGSPIHLCYVSGSSLTSGINASFSGTNAPTTASIADGDWHHYAISVDATLGTASLYVDGKYRDFITGDPISEVTGALVANIGSYYENRISGPRSMMLGTTVLSAQGAWCKLSASIDEFRFWKTARTDKQIGMNWFTQVGGGTNQDDANTDLGVYYKFNEGISLTASVDATVLDYSGRFSDGTWTGYTAGARNTGSAMVISKAAKSEFKDPIIYSFHPDVVSLQETKELLGELYDFNNPASIYHSFPGWILDEDNNGALLNLSQIVASFFDSLYLKIEELPNLKTVEYLSSSMKPYPFTGEALRSLGFETPDLFIDSDVMEFFANRNNTELFEDQIVDIKNTIYQNIYNNLIYIYKTKGTMKSFRNLLRCYGIDEELVRVNLYVDGATYEIEDDYRLQAEEVKFVNFAAVNRFGGTVFQTSSTDVSNTSTFLSASTFNHPMTIETQVIVPGKFPITSPLWYYTPFISASLFGMHEATDTEGDYNWAPGDDCNFQVYLVKEELNSTNAKFVFKSLSENDPFPTLESPLYKEVYDNTNWNIAVKIRPQYSLQDTGSCALTGSFILEFQGVQTEGDFIRNEFVLTSSLVAATGSNFIQTNKRLYSGAHKNNFSGSTREQTDVKITNNRVWYSHLDKEVIRIHARDSTNYGTKHPFRDAYAEYGEIDVQIPEINTLALSWGYNTLTGSGPSESVVFTAGFEVIDLSSGSVDVVNTYGSLDGVLKTQHPGRGWGFLENDNEAITKEYVSNAKLQPPETLQSDDLVQIINMQDEQIFTRESRPLDYVYAIEKGMQQVISDEMINVFGSIVDFNNLIGQPKNKYQADYEDMGKLREIFFSRIKNTPSLIKYVDFYKWIDGAITSMIAQLIPASANFSDKVATVIESHILERNKYEHKFPTVELEENEPNAPMRGINKLRYPYKTGQAPITHLQNQNCYWWKNRAYGAEPPLVPTSVFELRGGIISSSHQTFDRHYDSPVNFTAPDVQNLNAGVITLDVARQTAKFGSNGYLLLSTSSFTELDCTDDT